MRGASETGGRPWGPASSEEAGGEGRGAGRSRGDGTPSERGDGRLEGGSSITADSTLAARVSRSTPCASEDKSNGTLLPSFSS